MIRFLQILTVTILCMHGYRISSQNQEAFLHSAQLFTTKPRVESWENHSEKPMSGEFKVIQTSY